MKGTSGRRQPAREDRHHEQRAQPGRLRENADGEQLAVVIIVNNYEGSGADATQAIDRMAVRLADFTRRPSVNGHSPARRARHR